MALLVRPLPPLTTIFGLPRLTISRSTSRATRMPESEVSATSARHSRVQSSTTRQDAEAAAIRHKAKRPLVVRRYRNQHRRPSPDRPLEVAAAAHRELLLPVEPAQPLVVDHITRPLEKNMHASVAETAAFLGDRLHTLPKAEYHPHRVVWYHTDSRWLYMPAVRSFRGHPPDERQLSASGRASPLLSQKILSRRIIQQGVSQQPLQLRVLALQRPRPLGLRDVRASEFSLPFVDAGVADTMLAAEIGGPDPASWSFKIPMICSSESRLALYALVFALGQSKLQTGLIPTARNCDLLGIPKSVKL